MTGGIIYQISQASMSAGSEDQSIVCFDEDEISELINWPEAVFAMFCLW